MWIIEGMRTGDISMLLVLMVFSLIVIAPLALLTAKLKNRLHTSVIILCLVPGFNIYALFFLMLMRKVPDTKTA